MNDMNQNFKRVLDGRNGEQQPDVQKERKIHINLQHKPKVKDDGDASKQNGLDLNMLLTRL